ncbi:MAG: pyridoxamine 5'-phosphate oxidase [Microthrixaceae bacterium]
MVDHFMEGVDLGHRVDYDWGVLLESEAAADPLDQLERWLAESEQAGVPEFNAMALTTVDAEGRPRSRNVLLRGTDEDGRLWFFTNRDSAKGRDLRTNPRVCLLFSWLGIHRQVRIQGTAVPLTDEQSDAYFATRPRDSRIGAWASEQSAVLADRAELERRVDEFVARFGDGDVPRPPNWGGYAVTPDEFEFWQGRPSRLHDRLRYRPADVPGDGTGTAWVIERLSP